MKTPREIEHLAEQALNSLDGAQQAEANPYLYQKIRSRMLQQRQQGISKNARLVLKLSAALVLFMGINLTSYYLLNKGQQVNKPKS
jgi:hypothetical protein